MLDLQLAEPQLYESPYPSIEPPTTPVWDFMFKRNNISEKEAHKIVYLEEDTGEQLRSFELQRHSFDLAHALLQKGLRKGDMVVFFSENTIQFPVLVYALFAAGIVCSPANSLYQPEELAYQIEDSGAAAVIVSPTRLETAKVACQLTRMSKSLYVLSDNDVDGVPCLNPHQADATQQHRLGLVDAEDTALLCYSSGTSGTPKGVQLSHGNLTSAILQAMTMTPGSFTPSEVWISVLPMAHMFGVIAHILLATHIRATVIIFRQFHLKRFARAIETYRATVSHIVPPIAVLLTKEDMESSTYDFSSLREWRTGAAPLGKDLQSLLENKWGVPVYSWYGMSETGGIVTISDASTKLEPGALGILAPNMTAKILGNGELCLRGPNIMRGYQNRPKVNAETFDDEGFMHTGDVVEIHSDGYIYILDRLKEIIKYNGYQIIKYNGYQVAPAELEDLLLRHEDINDVAVIGTNDVGRATELPLAFVVLRDWMNIRDTATLDSKRSGIQDYVAERVAHHKRLRGGVIFVNKIPKRRELHSRERSTTDELFSPSGKILRVKLREYLKTGWLSLSSEESQTVLTLKF
ncbi:4-coumarate--CoA ligase-like 7 [Leucoagaricus sp. SymC.cos]|nr:4-coumarate--CoA ligase-like 7 [Leucoagaricus sp. SymC.cos]